MSDEREVLRCLFCELIQFRTQDGNCRRCHRAFHVPEIRPELESSMQGSNCAPDAMRFIVKVGDKIRETRIAKHLTQLQLAERMDVPRTYISKIENNTIPTLASLQRVAEALRVEVWQLVCTERDVQERDVATDPFLVEMATVCAQLSSGTKDFVVDEAKRLAQRNQGYR